MTQVCIGMYRHDLYETFYMQLGDLMQVLMSKYCFSAQSLLAIRSLFPKCSVRLVQGAGHWVHSEKPEQFLSVVIDFMLG